MSHFLSSPDPRLSADSRFVQASREPGEDAKAESERYNDPALVLYTVSILNAQKQACFVCSP